MTNAVLIGAKNMMSLEGTIKNPFNVKLSTAAENCETAELNDISSFDCNDYEKQIANSEKEAKYEAKHPKKIRYLEEIKIPSKTRLRDAEQYVNVENYTIKWDSFEIAKDTVKYMKLQTLEDYFLFFASANFLNSCAKQLKAKDQLNYADYIFKNKVQEVVNNMCVDKKFLKNPKLTDNIKLKMGTDKGMSSVLVSVRGIQFGFHGVNNQNIVPKEIEEDIIITRKRDCAAALFEFAVNLGNLTEESTKFEHGKPVDLRDVQNTAWYRAKTNINLKRCDDVIYVNKYPNHEIQALKEKYGVPTKDTNHINNASTNVNSTTNTELKEVKLPVNEEKILKQLEAEVYKPQSIGLETAI